MALIKCPECGNQISSNAKQCIHCGCKFTACPDCGHVSVGITQTCPQCGYSFKKEKTYDTTTDVAFTEEESEINDDLITKWKKVSPVDGMMMKVLKIIKRIVNILPMVFIAVLIWSLMNWINSDALEKFATLQSTVSTVKGMVAIICILGIIDVLYDAVLHAYIKLNCSKWLRATKTDAVGYLRVHGYDKGNSEQAENYALLSEAAFLSDEYKNKNSVYFGLLVRLVCAVAMFTAFGICIMQNLTELMQIKVNGKQFEFQYMALIVTVVIAVIYVVCVIACDTAYGKKHAAWFNENLKEIL